MRLAVAGVVVIVALSTSVADARPPPAPAPAPPAAPAPAPPDERCAPRASRDRVRVLVLDLKGSSAAASFGQIVAGEAARVAGTTILSADEVRTALDQEANKQLAGCDQNSCLAELAQALDAELVVGGSVERTVTADGHFDGPTLVSLTLLNARAIVVVNRVSMSWAGAQDALPDVVRAAAQTLLLEPQDRPPGALELIGLPADARVFVDGAEHPVQGGVLHDLAIGPHEVKAEVPDKLPAVIHAVVKSKSTTAVTVALEDVPVDGAWLWLGGAGAVVVGGVAAVGLAYAFGKSDVVVQASIPPVTANDAESLRRTK